MTTIESADADHLVARILADPRIKAALDFLRKDQADTLAEQKAIAVIPSPPLKEQVRAADYRERLAALGFDNARIDSEGNVIAVRPGRGNGPKLVVSAHLDTVFPEDTDLTVKEKDGKLYAPGIGDDTRGLAEILSIVRALNATGLETVGDIYFVGTVGEEGLGDLRGVKALFRDHRDIDGFISIDGPQAGRISYLAVGSRRYRVTFHGHGGHSFHAFGQPSAIHAMGRAIATISELRTPEQPKTTFTVGIVSGGTSVNTISSEAVMEVDIRSVETPALLNIEAGILKAIGDAVDAENARWGSDKTSVELKPAGDRPAGTQPLGTPIMQATLLVTRAVGLEPIVEEAASSDANLPISLGIPAVTMGRGGNGENTHTIREWFDPTDAYLGPQRDLLAALVLVGVDGVTEPFLAKRLRKH